jgi:hypothetical protein
LGVAEKISIIPAAVATTFSTTPSITVVAISIGKCNHATRRAVMIREPSSPATTAANKRLGIVHRIAVLFAAAADGDD